MIESPLRRLAADPSGSALGVALPAGRVIDDHCGAPVLWFSDAAPAADLIWQVRTTIERSGLWPLLLGDLPSSRPEDALRPWLSGEIGEGYATDPGSFDAAAVLERWWAERVGASDADDADPHLVGPFAEWPGLAPGGTGGDSDGFEELCRAVVEYLPERLSNPRLGLVACGRGADAPAALGWTGPANFGTDVAPFCAVLRSWEDRFGIRVVALTFDAMYCTVAAPPSTLDHALHVAAEHVAFCPDNVLQGAGSLQAYAKALLGSPVWSFWWD